MTAGYHPFLFHLITAIAGAELGLTAYLIHDYEKQDSGYPSPRHRSLIIFILFDACWTFLCGLVSFLVIVDGTLHTIALIASSPLWLVITAILWGVAAGMFHNVRRGGIVNDEPTISRNRQTQTIEALAWTNFGLCVWTLLVAYF